MTSASVGYALAAALRPQITQQLTSFLSVILLLFSPINYPIGRLPGWLQAVHEVLPVKYMADLVRYCLTGRYVAHPALAFIVVGAWCAAGLAVRRGSPSNVFRSPRWRVAIGADPTPLVQPNNHQLRSSVVPTWIGRQSVA